MSLAPELVAVLRGVRTVAVITGAGVSAESGIQTYRGSGGLYDDPDEGNRTVEALSGPTLNRDPDRTWRTVAQLAVKARGARPNRAHEALVRLENGCTRFVLLTQNVDGLHQRAGSRNIIDIHGHVFDTRCTACSRRGHVDDPSTIAAAPRCPDCDEVMRPDVVLFEEMLPFEKLQRIRSELIDNPPDLTLVVGTSALFPYVIEPVIVARAMGRSTVEINPESTLLSAEVDHVVRAPAGVALPAIVDAILVDDGVSRSS